MHDLHATIELTQRATYIIGELATVTRKAHIAPLALEQRHAQLALERLDGVGKRRLTDIELFCGLSVVLELCEFAEVVQLRQVHAGNHPVLICKGQYALLDRGRFHKRSL